MLHKVGLVFISKHFTMQWFGGRESNNVEEGSSGGGGRGFYFGGGIIGIIGLLIYLFTGINPSQLLSGQGSGDNTQQQNTRVANGPEGVQKKFARVVLAGTEDVWSEIFSSMGRTYTKPTLHLYSEVLMPAGVVLPARQPARSIVRPIRRFISILLFLPKCSSGSMHRVSLPQRMLLHMRLVTTCRIC